MDLIATTTAEVRALLPRGAFWRHAMSAPVMSGLIRATGTFFARVRERFEQADRESDPRFTSERIVDWERSVGLPDGCMSADANLQRRRVAVHARLTARGGNTLAYLKGLAVPLGYPDLDIREIGTNELLVVMPGDLALAEMTCNDLCTDALRTFSGVAADPQLECVLDRFKPAHVGITYQYGS